MFTVRKAKLGDELGIAEVHVASWKTTYAGLIPNSFLSSLSVEKRAAMWAGAIREMQETSNLKAVFVCEDGSGRIQGFVAGGVEREPGCGFDSELYAVYLYKEMQQKGLGRRLTHELAKWLHQNSYGKMRLWVLENNPSRRFYESIGGKLLPHSKTVDFGGKACLEIAYGWHDLGLLAKTLAI